MPTDYIQLWANCSSPSICPARATGCEAMPFQKVQFPWRSKSCELQVGTLHLLHVGGVEQDQGGDRGVDLPNVNLGGRVWWNPWTFSWIFFYLSLGQL